MKAFRAHAGVRVCVVVATMLSWFVLFNHCALGGMSDSPEVHQCCASTVPVDEDGGDDTGHVVQCCKTMRALLSDAPPVVGAPFFWLPYSAAHSPEIEIPAREIIEAFQPATGPPERGGFLLPVVLKHSVPALAPPTAA